MIYSLDYLFGLLMPIFLLSLQCLSFFCIKLWEHLKLRVGKKREDNETIVTLKLVYLEKSSCKRFGQKLTFNMLSFFSVSSGWIIECWPVFFQSRSSIFLARLAPRTRSNNDLLPSLADTDLSGACEKSVLRWCFGVVSIISVKAGTSAFSLRLQHSLINKIH